MPKYQHAPNILATELAPGEHVMMDTDFAKYFGLTDTAAAIWTLFATPISISEAVDELTTEYDIDAAECTTETTKFVEDLVKRRMLVIAP